MKKSWKLYEIILTIIAVLLLLTVIFSFVGFISITDFTVGALLFVFYIIIAFLFFKENKVISLLFVIVAIINALSYILWFYILFRIKGFLLMKN